MLRYFEEPKLNIPSRQNTFTVERCHLCEKNPIRWKCVDCRDLFCDACRQIHERSQTTRNHQITSVEEEPQAKITSKDMAQTIAFCQLCENNSIRWKCVDCCDLFCDACKKIHERGKATRNHQITAVKDVNEELLAVSVLSLECRSHHSTCTMYCSTCNRCACANCVTDNHTGHVFQDLKSLLDKRRKDIRAVLNQIDTECLPELQNLLQYLPNYVHNHKQEVEFLKHEIENRSKTLKDAVDQTMKHYIGELSRYSKGRLDKFNTYESTVPEQIQNLQAKQAALRKLLQPTNIDEVTALITSSNLYSNVTPVQKPEPGGVTFIPGKLNESEIKREFGSLSFKKRTENREKRTSAPQAEEAKTITLFTDKQIQTLSTHLPSVTSIATAHKGTMWVGCANTKRLELLDADGQMKGEMPPIMTNVLGFSLNRNQDLFVTDTDNYKVRRRASSSGKLTLVKAFTNKIPVSIYVDIHEEPAFLYVGLIDSLIKLKEDYSKANGLVVKMTIDGTEKNTFETVEHSEPSRITVPNRLTINAVTKSLLITDSTSHNKGRVIAISKDDGTVHFIYSRSQNHTEHPFNPSDFVCTKSGKIIVCDGSNDLLHVLDHNGRLNQCVNTKSIGIKYPWSLALTDKNKLCIGTFTYTEEKQTKDSQKGVVYVVQLQ